MYLSIPRHLCWTLHIYTHMSASPSIHHPFIYPTTPTTGPSLRLVHSLQVNVQQDVLFFCQAWLTQNSSCKKSVSSQMHKSLWVPHISMYEGSADIWTSLSCQLSHPSPKTSSLVFWKSSLDSFHESSWSQNGIPSFWSDSLFFLKMVIHCGPWAAQSWVGLSLTVDAVPMGSFGVWWPFLAGDIQWVAIFTMLSSHFPLIPHVNLRSDCGSSWKSAFWGCLFLLEKIKNVSFC